jgi:hypothetical protein
MFNRWHTGHSLGAGTLVGITLAGHAWLVFVLGIVVGIGLAYMRQSAAWVAGVVRDHQARRREPRRSAAELIPHYRTRAGGQTDEVPF